MLLGPLPPIPLPIVEPASVGFILLMGACLAVVFSIIISLANRQDVRNWALGEVENFLRDPDAELHRQFEQLEQRTIHRSEAFKVPSSL
ncbi:MAG: hypothetical protein JWN89_191 [Parcubacteria group bacterium]|nr:hypothetical protein [Parcubacteria group bacterium]